jgi:uncharacterized protein (DUF1697 family)
MASVRSVVEELGYADVWTLANSGNVAFDATGSRGAIERKIGGALESELGFEVTTFVRTAAELRSILDLQPFTLTAGDTYFVTFLAQRATAAQSKALEAMSDDFDTLVVRGRDVHWRMRGRSTDTHLTKKRWEDVIGQRTSTSRNTTLLARLVAKLDG